jgi:hypothetical protein
MLPSFACPVRHPIEVTVRSAVSSSHVGDVAQRARGITVVRMNVARPVQTTKDVGTIGCRSVVDADRLIAFRHQGIRDVETIADPD